MMTENKLVSLLLPIYNETSLATIETVCKQSHKNMQLILLNYDPELTIQVEDICSKYLLDEEMVDILNVDPASPSGQDLLKLVKGQYLLSLNHMDELDDSFIETALTSAEQYQSDIVLLENCNFNENDGNYYFHDNLFKEETVSAETVKEHFQTSPRHKTYLINPYCKLFKTSYLRDKNIDLGQDLTPESYETDRISYVKETLYVYRKIKEELISVIVPVYNVENYLHECLDSILNQTYQNLEIILVNDGSTDSSGRICDDYAAKDSRIKVIHQENGGLSDARNKGLDTMTGQFVTFVDSDDIIYHDAIEIMYHYLKQTHTSIAVSNYYEFSKAENGNFTSYFFDINTNNAIEILPAKEALFRQFDYTYNGVIYTTAWGKLISRACLENVYFNLRIFEDEATVYKWYLNAEQVVQVNRNLYMYRRNDSGLTKSRFKLSDIDNLMRAFEEKISDYVLAGLDVQKVNNIYIPRLHYYAKILEENNYTDTLQYHKVIQKLKQYNKYRK
ncbi:TPA: glycosyltransferase [Streptococcus suis]